ncbi:kinase, partial [Thraustotheca clavata]
MVVIYKNTLPKKRNDEATVTNYTTLEIAWVIANGLADIHGYRCIHRDLKSPNVLLSTKHYIKIADFGLVHEVNSTMTHVVSGRSWTAPEMLKSGKYSYPADIYSFGVILTELDTLALPYSHITTPMTEGELFDGVCDGSL